MQAAPHLPPQSAPAYAPHYYAPVKPKTNSFATTSMVLGIVALVIPFVGIVTGPLAIIFSAKAKKEMRFNGEGGNGLATAGLVTGILGCAGYALFLLLMVVGAMGSTAGGV